MNEKLAQSVTSDVNSNYRLANAVTWQCFAIFLFSLFRGWKDVENEKQKLSCAARLTSRGGSTGLKRRERRQACRPSLSFIDSSSELVKLEYTCKDGR